VDLPTAISGTGACVENTFYGRRAITGTAYSVHTELLAGRARWGLSTHCGTLLGDVATIDRRAAVKRGGRLKNVFRKHPAQAKPQR
jgi:hypothetical protein